MTRGRLITVAFLVSLTINLLFIGAFIGHRMRGAGTHQFPPHFGWMIRNLDDETRDELKPVLERQREQLIPLRQKMREAQIRFNEALVRDPLDEAKLNKAITDLRETSAKFQAAMHDQAMFLIKHMDAEEREKVARYLRHRRPGDKHRARQ